MTPILASAGWYFLSIFVALAVGFVGGMLFGKRNAAIVTKVNQTYEGAVDAARKKTGL